MRDQTTTLTSKKLIAELESDLVSTFKKQLTGKHAQMLDTLFLSKTPLSAKDLLQVLGKATAGNRDVIDQTAGIRQTINGLRDHIETFSTSGEGMMHQLGVTLPKVAKEEGAYQLVFHEQNVHSKKSWHPYLDSGRNVLIVYTAPQFFRLGEHVFLRHQDVNRDSVQDLKALFRWDEIVNGSDYTSTNTSRHYVSVGESHAALMLTRWFERMSIKTDHIVAREWTDIDISGRNVVLMGNYRTFGGLNKLLVKENFNYLMGPYHIEDRTDRSSPKRIDDVFEEEQPVRGIVSRFHSPERDSHVTFLSSNHGRFFAGAVRALTTNLESALLWNKLGLEDLIVAPKSFQFVGQVDVGKDDGPLSPDPMDVILPKPSKSAAVDPESPNL